MTTTSTYQGLNENSKTSSRVLNPPGGGSSNIFGVPERTNTQQVKQAATKDAPPAQVPPPKVQPQTQSVGRGPKNSGFNPITGEPYDVPKPKPASSQPPEVKEDEKEREESSEPSQSAEAPKAATEQNPARAPKEEREHTSTRILNPPGGRSTKLW